MSERSHPSTELDTIDGEFYIVRCEPDSDARQFDSALSVTRTARELSVVCLRSDVPPNSITDGPWAAFYTQGSIAFGTTGIVAGLVTPLADIGCPVFVVSTFDGDILMVPTSRRAHAIDALRAAGHTMLGLG